MKFINFDDIVNKNENNYINKNVFAPQHYNKFLKPHYIFEGGNFLKN